MIAVGLVGAVCALVTSVCVAGRAWDVAQHQPVRPGTDPVVTTFYPVAHPRGLMVTSGGWVYCEQVRPIAKRTGYATAMALTAVTVFTLGAIVASLGRERKGRAFGEAPGGD